MSRITQTFEGLRRQQRKALVPFVTAGDPDATMTVPLMHALVHAGADILELGVPFSDPMADGPIIQRASERALRNHISLRDVLKMIKEFRARDPRTPLVLMGYLNPFEIMGYDSFAKEAAAVGVDGVITVDVPPEEAGEFSSVLRDNGLDPIFLLAPTSTDDRIKLISRAASGFIYYVSLRGVTGASHLNVDAVAEKLSAIRGHTALPVGVGFGINSPQAAAAIAGIADAVVVGSAVVKRIGELLSQPERVLTEVPAFVASLRRAMDQVGAST
ncbi:MAG: tryptophan synthase subunit alpha [Acidiferrobacterales bacterium]